MRSTVLVLTVAIISVLGCNQAEEVASPVAAEMPPVTVVTNDSGESMVEFSVPGLHCENCAGRCEMVLTEQPGVESVEIDLENKVVIAKVEKDKFAGEDTLLALRDKFPKSTPAAVE